MGRRLARSCPFEVDPEEGVVAFEGFSDEALQFYEGLEADNSKTYWSDHRQVWEDEVRAPMLALLDELASEFGGAHVFRPNRDIRFSADKSPYKTAIGAHTEGGGYVQLSARGLFVAAGYWQTTSDQVARLREAVAGEGAGPALARLVDALEAQGYEVSGAQLKTHPRGYDPDHPRLRLLRHKTLTAHRDFGAPPWLHTPAARDQVAEAWRAMRPLSQWLDNHVGPSNQPAAKRR
jgi:uncharacterized protein (TIGR02453 family)